LSSTWALHPYLTAASTSGVILSAWYLFMQYGRVFLGPLRHDKQKTLKDLSLRETLVLVPLVASILFIGVRPNPFLGPMDKSLQMTVLSRLTPPPLLMDFAAQERRAQERKDFRPEERHRP
jgi:NADH:ubiquinone oxidoreductase subunit 4 (subunit M)